MASFSNSKLCSVQKELLRDMLNMAREQGVLIYCNVHTGVTAVMREKFPGSHVVQVATAVQSPDEKKFRAKVGMYYALDNLFHNDRFIHMPSPYGVFGRSDITGENFLAELTESM